MFVGSVLFIILISTKNMIKLSVIIPSYREPYLNKTVESLLENSELGKDELEVICVLDGMWAECVDDPRVKVLHLGKNRGMRGGINAGMAIAKGEFVARLDAHCKFAKGWDKVITDTCEPNWIVTPLRYYLDPVKWERMDLPPVGFAKLVIGGQGADRKFSAANWKERDEEMKDVMIGETMGMQGSLWVMPRALWENVIGELQIEGYGHLIQDSHEVIFKIWKMGGKCMLNKNTWYAHKHRSFARSHNNGTPDNPANCQAGYKYALDVWSDYYFKEIVPKWGI